MGRASAGERVGVGWTETLHAHYFNMNLCSTQRPANRTVSGQTRLQQTAQHSSRYQSRQQIKEGTKEDSRHRSGKSERAGEQTQSRRENASVGRRQGRCPQTQCEMCII